MTADFASSPPPDADDLDPALLECYWLGDTSPEETRAVDRWFQLHPEWSTRYDKLRRGVVEDPRPDFSPAEIRRTIMKTLEATGLSVQALEHPSPSGYSGRSGSVPFKAPANVATRQPSRFHWVKYALSACVLSAVSLVIGWQSGVYRLSTAMSNYKSTYTTPNGQQATITLADGSEVLLNAGSRLDVPNNFAVGTRTLRLTGEAMFTVVQQSETPFVVVAGPSTTRVLGTKFAVRHYETDTTATIAVQQGKVSVHSTVLSANQRVEVGPNGLVDIQAAGAEQFGFAQGRLIVTGLKLVDAIPVLNRWYDVDIRLDDPALGERQLTLESTGRSVIDLQTAFEVTLASRVIREGRTITLFPR